MLRHLRTIQPPTRALILILIVVIFLRLRLLDVPLERDEGEYAYMAQLLLDGIPPYAEAYNMKFPGIYVVFAMILALFGETVSGIHIGLLLANLVSITLLFLLAKVVYDAWVGVAACGAFALMTLSHHLHGFWANAEHFVLPFVLAAFLALYLAHVKWRGSLFFVSGALFGIATTVKQHALFFVGGAALLLLRELIARRSQPRQERLVRGIQFLAGMAAPFVILVVYLMAVGVFDRFFFWTFTYARAYISELSFSEGAHYLRGNLTPIIKTLLPLWILSAVGILSFLSKVHSQPQKRLLFTILIAGLFAVVPGYYFRPHYFLLLTPGIALTAGLGIRSVLSFFHRLHQKVWSYGASFIVITASVVGCIGAHADILFDFTPEYVTRVVFGSNPFAESLPVAQFLKERSTVSDKVAVIGSEPQIYFYSQRRAATGYLYHYPLIERQPYAAIMREEMMRQVESSSPRFLVYPQILPSWYKKREGMAIIDNWFATLTKNHFQLVARLEYGANVSPRLITDRDSLQNPSTTTFWMAIYERKSVMSSAKAN